MIDKLNDLEKSADALRKNIRHLRGIYMNYEKSKDIKILNVFVSRMEQVQLDARILSKKISRLDNAILC